MKIVALSEIKWQYLRTRKIHFFKRFPPQWKILFIEPFTLRGKNFFFPRREGNVIYVTVPFLKNVPMTCLRRLLEYKKVRKLIGIIVFFWIKALEFITGFTRCDVIFISNIYYIDIAQRLGKALILYDCNDDPLAFPLVPAWAEEYFIKLCQKADVITVCSEDLIKKVRQYTRVPVFIVGNGVEFDHFAQRITENNIPDDIRRVRRPILGYVGTLSEWVDSDLIEKLAQRYPQTSLVLIGPITREFATQTQKLRNFDNIYFLGEKNYFELPKYLAIMDVCLLPFKQNELTQTLNPNKLYEYFAAGKPVVTLNYSSSIRQYKDVLFVAESHNEFIDKVAIALKTPVDIQKLQAIAKANSWDSKAQEMVHIIEEFSISKRRSSA